MKINIDEDKCCAAGQCALLVPEVFDQSPDTGQALLLTGEPDAELHECVREAAAMCPSGAITVTE